MKRIKTFMLAAAAFALTAPLFTACGSDDKDNEKEEKKEVIDNNKVFCQIQPFL